MTLGSMTQNHTMWSCGMLLHTTTMLVQRSEWNIWLVCWGEGSPFTHLIHVHMYELHSDLSCHMVHMYELHSDLSCHMVHMYELHSDLSCQMVHMYELHSDLSCHMLKLLAYDMGIDDMGRRVPGPQCVFFTSIPRFSTSIIVPLYSIIILLPFLGKFRATSKQICQKNLQLCLQLQLFSRSRVNKLGTPIFLFSQ